MKLIVKVYNRIRLSFLLLGIAFVVMGVLGLIDPDEYAMKPRGGAETSTQENLKAAFLILSVGLTLVIIRFKFMKFRKNDDYSNEIPLPNNVRIEKTNDVNENIKRYKEAQRKKRDGS